ncbi:MAG: hypothetical protein U1F71_24125 [Verrucomicrobiaceae bacterium]
MLGSRSTRLAATLLLALLFGWTVRAWRHAGVTTNSPVTTPATSEPVESANKSSFPDE